MAIIQSAAIDYAGCNGICRSLTSIFYTNSLHHLITIRTII